MVRSSVGRSLKNGAVVQDVSFLCLFRLHNLELDKMIELITQFMVLASSKCAYPYRLTP